MRSLSGCMTMKRPSTAIHIGPHLFSRNHDACNFGFNAFHQSLGHLALLRNIRSRHDADRTSTTLNSECDSSVSRVKQVSMVDIIRHRSSLLFVFHDLANSVWLANVALAQQHDTSTRSSSFRYTCELNCIMLTISIPVSLSQHLHQASR